MNLYKQMRSRKIRTCVRPFAEHIVDMNFCNPTYLVIGLGKSNVKNGKFQQGKPWKKKHLLNKKTMEERKEEAAAKF